MKIRLQALLIHGMGNNAAWWNPFLEPLQRCGIKPVPLKLPDLESDSPQAWVNTVVNAHNQITSILIGHSLGAAVALEAARVLPVEGIFLLSMPVFSQSVVPPEEISGLSATALARIGLFLRNAVRKEIPECSEIVHLIGSNDPYVDIIEASKHLYPVEVLSGGSHELNSEKKSVAAIMDRVIHSVPVRMLCDPGKRYTALNTIPHTPATALNLGTIAPPPGRIDIEITTACQLTCPYCARTRLSSSLSSTETYMSIDTFKNVLSQFPYAEELVFVGLGEPLLNDTIDEMVKYASSENIKVKLVTNGIAADPDKLEHLRMCGLSEVVFSIDSLDHQKFSKLRGGADLEIVLDNFRHVPDTLVKSVFVTLSQKNISDLRSIIDLAVEEQLPAVGITDLNFTLNQDESLSSSGCREELIEGIRYAHNCGILLIGPHLHNTPDVVRTFRHFMVRYPSDITGRSMQHQNCLAPWRTAVIDVNGNLNPCNCAPEVVVPAEQVSLAKLWNSSQMQQWRFSVMQSDNSFCKGCPRF